MAVTETRPVGRRNSSGSEKSEDGGGELGSKSLGWRWGLETCDFGLGFFWI